MRALFKKRVGVIMVVAVFFFLMIMISIKFSSAESSSADTDKIYNLDNWYKINNSDVQFQYKAEGAP